MGILDENLKAYILSDTYFNIIYLLLLIVPYLRPSEGNISQSGHYFESFGVNLCAYTRTFLIYLDLKAPSQRTSCGSTSAGRTGIRSASYTHGTEQP